MSVEGCMKTVFVRPGKQLTLKSSCHHIFGSGRGDVKLTTSEGVSISPEKKGVVERLSWLDPT